ncbi:MAG: AI-2E family transporter, partial [Bacteroidetes bacterium QH_8_67_23]
MAHSRLSGYTRRVLIAAGAVVGIVGAVYFLWELARVFLLIFAGVLLAVFVGGLATKLAERTPLPRGAALAVVGGGIVAFFVGIGFLAGPRIAAQSGELAERLPQAVERIRQQLISQYGWAEPFLKGVPDPQQVIAGAGSGGLAGGVVGAVSTASRVLTDALVVVVLGIYMALAPRLYTNGAVRLVPRGRQRKRTGEVLSAIGHALRWWLVGRGASMAVVGLLTGAGLFIASVPLAFTLGLIAALFSFVPYIGPIASAVPALLVALTVSPTKALYVLVVYAGVQFCESYLITPLIQERVVSIPPALLISAQVVAGVLAGVLGILLASPMAVVLVVAVQMLYVEDTLGDRLNVLGEGE